MNEFPSASASVSARIGLFIMHAAQAQNISPQTLALHTDFNPSDYADPDARIPLTLETLLWNTAAILCNDEDFGLHAAEWIRPGVFDVFDYAVRTAPNLDEAMQRLIRYNRLVHDLAAFNLIKHGETVRIEHRFTSPGTHPCRHASEFTLASLLTIAEQMTGVRLKPLALTFAHPKPKQISEHARIFGKTPGFDSTVTSLTLPREILSYPVIEAYPGLSRIVMAHAEKQLAAASAPDITTIVRSHLAASMAQGPLTLSQIAQKMHLSERTLQRRLESEGVHFSHLSDEVRKELALRYIADPHLSMGEVAYLLGFSETSSFHRAFKRWTGMTPVRARHMGKRPQN